MHSIILKLQSNASIKKQKCLTVKQQEAIDSIMEQPVFSAPHHKSPSRAFFISHIVTLNHLNSKKLELIELKLMKSFIRILLILFCVVLFAGLYSAKAQGEDPEQLLKFNNKEQVDNYMKENKWKILETEPDEEDGEYYLYRKKSYGGGFNYVAVFPSKFVHSQKWEDEKKDYSKVISYEEFVLTPAGRTAQNEVIINEQANIKFIKFNDPSKTRNENNFYGNIPSKE